MHIEKSILPGTYEAVLEQNQDGQIVAEIAEGENKGEKIIFTPKKANGEVKNHKQRRLRHRSKKQNLS